MMILKIINTQITGKQSSVSSYYCAPQHDVSSSEATVIPTDVPTALLDSTIKPTPLGG